MVLFEVDGIAQPLTNELPNLLEQKQPTTEWPLILCPMKAFAQPGDQGLGDIVERTIGPVGGTAYKAWYRATFGKPCGCTKRKDKLNERYPL